MRPSFFQLDEILEFVDEEVSKKNERQRLHLPTTKQLREDEDPPKTSLGIEQWDEATYMKFYFLRERAVMEQLYGDDWRKYLKHPDLPRKQYYVEERRRDSSEDRKRQKEMAARAKKKKGGSIFRKY